MKSEIRPSSLCILIEDKNGDYGEWINSNDYNTEIEG